MKLAISLILCCLMTSCKNVTESSQKKEYQVLSGETMGTYYRVTIGCQHPQPGNELKQSIDSLLQDINQAVSTYISDSEISKLNQSPSNVELEIDNHHFSTNLHRAQFWYQKSGGYMDVSVMPLINFWGFGYTDKRAVANVDSSTVDSIMNLVGLDKWNVSPEAVVKQSLGQQLDFSALAKGYAVDQVSQLLMSRGCKDHLVDIGGEGVAKGKNPKKKVWTLGISSPTSDAAMHDIELVVRLEDRAMASSGNYRIFHKVGDHIYGHTIDPTTGYPYQDSLLSVSIIADYCIDADAIATACMAMGYVKAATFIDSQPEVSACFLVGASDGTIKTRLANGFIRYVVE